MRTSLLNTIFILVGIFGADSAFAFKGTAQTSEPLMQRPPMNEPAFENTEHRLDGSTLFHDVAIIPDCKQGKIKLVDGDTEISFVANDSVCNELISDVGWGNCSVRAGSVLVEKVSAALGMISWYEVTKIDHFQEGCLKLRGGKAY